MASIKANRELADLMTIESPLDIAIDFIKKNLDPDEVFEQKELEAWAESNGYVKE